MSFFISSSSNLESELPDNCLAMHPPFPAPLTDLGKAFVNYLYNLHQIREVVPNLQK
jgi:hypothetical protein